MTSTDGIAAEVSKEYARAAEYCPAVASSRDEQEVLRQIPETFSAIFLPQRTLFWVLENSRVIQMFIHPVEPSSPGWVGEYPPPGDFRSDPALPLPDVTPSGFRVRISSPTGTLGILETEGIPFPDQAVCRLPLATAVAEVCGAAVACSRGQRMIGQGTCAGGRDLDDALDRLSRLIRQHSAEMIPTGNRSSRV